MGNIFTLSDMWGEFVCYYYVSDDIHVKGQKKNVRKGVIIRQSDKININFTVKLYDPSW